MGAGMEAEEGVMATDFFWSYTDEPHASRRREILAKYPQIKELFGPDPWAFLKIALVVSLQLWTATFLRDASWLKLLTVAYFFGSFLNHNLFLAIHELSHNLAFTTPSLNRWLGIFANLPIGVPMSVTFQKYHLEHHRFQGVDGVDMDVPSQAEAHAVRSSASKSVWVVLQLFFYALRPLFLKPKPPGLWELTNLAVQVGLDAGLVCLCGWRSLAYLVLSTFVGGGMHPMAGHFISEHYVFNPGQETYSYYGPLNLMAWHVGYHNEHHDFPRIPGTRLHRVKEIAPEYYDSLKSYRSWSQVIYMYIMDQTVGPFRPRSFKPFPAGIRPNPPWINPVWKRYRLTTKQVFVSSRLGLNPGPPRRFPAQPGRETSLVSASWKESVRRSVRGGGGGYVRHGGGSYVRYRDRRPRGERQLADPCNPFGGCFSPIVPAPVQVGEDELPPSWDPIPSPLVNMLGRGSPRLNMLGRGSPRFNMLLSKGAQKKKSPIATASKTHGGSPKGKTRANWNSMLEKTLVDLLHEHNTPEYKGNNGWTPDAWNKIAKEFQERERYAGFSKVQIQEKEKELKRDYRMLKDARKQSGVSWDERRCMIQADPLIWDNIIKSFPRAKKFRNKSFPLFEALGELHDGNTAEGTYNFTSTQPNGPDLTQIGTGDVPINVEDHEDVGDPLADHRQNEAEDRVYEVEGVDVNVDKQDERPKRTGDVPRNGEEKGPKRQKKSSNIEVLMERYLDFRSKQVEDEATQLAREREARGGDDFSIKNCIAVLNTLEVTKKEKVKAYKVFKDPDNRQIFLSACNDDREAALMWLRDEMA